MLPLLVALTLAIALGRLLVLAYVSGWPPLGGSIGLGMLVGAAFVGALLVGLTVAPVIRTRITPDTLRRE